MSNNQKFCFVTDEDSHLNLIPLELKDKFEQSCKTTYESEEFDEFEDLFVSYRKGSSISCFSFEKPEEIE